MTVFNDRKDFVNAIYNAIQMSDYDVMANGDLVDLTQCIRNEDGQVVSYDIKWALVGNIYEDQYIDLHEGFKFDSNYKYPIDLAMEFERYLRDKVEYINLKVAQTSSCYVSFTVNDDEYKVRFADHSDCYANSDFNCASDDDNLDGRSYSELIKWANSIIQLSDKVYA